MKRLKGHWIMKIKKININNIGPYVENNEFDFDVSDNIKRMVLIGGKNGAGKTTLFNAIKVCLYGCVAFGFEINNAKYYAEVEKIINSSEKLKKVGEASVVIELLFDDGKDNHIYTFDRSWKITGKNTYEKFDVYRDGSILSETEKNDFESYLLQLLPPDLFKFYFFDGEKISDFVFNGRKNSDFKEAFLKLCSLDTMEIIRDNFKRISRTKAKGINDLATQYDTCLKEYKIFEDRVTCAEDNYNNVISEISEIDGKLSALEKTYSKSGGITKKELRGMEEQILKEEIRRDEKRKWLKETANNVIPFLILSEHLEELKEQIILEHKAQVNENAKSAIDTPEIKTIISNVLECAGQDNPDDISEKIVNEISSYVSYTSKISPILNLSDFDRFELIAKIKKLLSFDKNQVKKATTDIDLSLKYVKRIREKIDKSSVENYEEYLQKKNDLNENKIELTQKLLEIDKELQQLRLEHSNSKLKLEKAKALYEEVIKKQSINDISARALLAFEDLQNILYNKNIKMVEALFEKHFKALINKSSLIDGIHIDNNLNVLPYKNKMFQLYEIKKVIEKNGVDYIVEQIGKTAYEILQTKLETNEPEFELPVEVKQQLSAGEKQVFIMALYQALSQLNKVNVPYIIDTPFARIDKEHRENILREFFKKLKGQIIILSTDEEISVDYVTGIKDVVSNTFVLNHTLDNRTEILKDTYFGGAML